MPRFCLSEIKTYAADKTAVLQNRESGYLLASTSIIILVIIALIGSFAFVMKRNSHFQGNYAAGERLASLAVMSHFYAQQTHYASDPYLSIENADLLPGMALPDEFAFAPVDNTKFEVEVKGADAAPSDIAMPNSLRAASAYIHLKIRTTNGKGRAPSDDIALQSGASHKGMARLGYYGLGIAAGDKCNGGTDDTVVRWGPEESACLGDNQVIAMFPDSQKGDIIAPVWETALAKINQSAMIRYPQPERTDMNIMGTALNMGTHEMLNAKNVNADKLNPSSTPAGTASIQHNLIVNNTSSFTKPAVMNGGINVYDQGGNPQPMNVAGSVNFTGGDVQVSQELKGGAGLLAVNADNPIGVQTLGVDTENMKVMPMQGSPSMTAGISKIVETIPGDGALSSLQLTGSASRLAVSDSVNAQSAKIRTGGVPLELYAAQLNTTGTTQVDGTTWNVKSISQIGNGLNQGLLVDDGVKLNNCFGDACNELTSTTPGGGGF